MTDLPLYKNAHVIIDGESYDYVNGFTYEGQRYESLTEVSRTSSGTYEVSLECTVPAGDFELSDFSALLPSKSHGASHETLVRRVRYGGRKGRSALRRLFAKALPVEMDVGHLRYYGSGVMLDETEMRARMHRVGFRPDAPSVDCTSNDGET